MLELEHAQEKILSLIQTLPPESVPLASALGRIVAQPILAPQDLPPFDNSAMDGYAVRSEDVRQASASAGVALQLMGQAAAGEVFPGELLPGQCVRLFTGSPLPAGADAVIMQEDTRVDPGQTEQPLMLEPVKPWENIRFRGEDVKQGSELLAPGERLRVGHVSLLAALGFAEVQVRQRPIVGLIATGSELREAGQPLAPGQIYESNRLSLALLAAGAGAVPKIYPLVEDHKAATQAALRSALLECDAVVTSGGVSVGEFDLVKVAFQELGGELAFWRVAIKPGKPFALGRWREKLLFGLPGNPVSAVVTFLLLVRPALLRLQGATETALPARPGTLTELVENRGDRRHFVRVYLGESGQVRPSGVQASHLLHSLAKANGLLDVPPKTIFSAGTVVPVLTWD